MIRAMAMCLSRIYAALLSLIAPVTCAACDISISSDRVLCSECATDIMPVVSKTIAVTDRYAMTVIAVGNYTGILRSLILAKNNLSAARSRQLGQILWHYSSFSNIACDFLVPVPLHWTRYAWRGYNQADEMASVLSQYRAVPVANLVHRRRRTIYQSLVQDRRENVKDAFELCTGDIDRYRGKHIVIVDDLMTSGATLIAVARQLRRLQPASITALVVCRVT